MQYRSERLIWSFATDDPLSAAANRSSLTESLIRHGCPSEFIQAIELAYGELAGNVVRYALGPVLVALTSSGESLVLRVEDGGPALDLSDAKLPSCDSEMGRGLFIVQAFAQRLYVEPMPHGKAVVAEFVVGARGRTGVPVSNNLRAGDSQRTPKESRCQVDLDPDQGRRRRLPR